MENCEYEQVASRDGQKSENLSWTPFLRQVFVCSGVWCCYFVLGLSMGATTVLIPQIRREHNSTDAISTETASWLTSIYGFAGVPLVPVIPILSHYFGRRVPYGFICLVSLIGSILFYCSTSVTHILISEVMTSLVAAGQITIYLVILSEYVSPKYRGLFLTLKSASFNWGVLVANTMGTFFHWKTIGILHIVCCSYISLSVLFWPESPYWLARKGKYEKCKRSFYWLKGTNEEAEKELNSIIELEREIVDGTDNQNLVPATNKAINVSKNVYKPLFLCTVLITSYYINGKTVCMMYALDIVKQITNSESLAYTTMLILDGISVFSMYLGCVLSRMFKRKQMFVTSTSLGVLFLSIICIYLFLIRFSVIVESIYVTLFLLTIYSITICCGPLLLSTCICSELLPLQHKNAFVCFVGAYDRLVLGVVLKVSPFMFAKLGTHGGFTVFALMSLTSLILLIKYLPETKDKTLCEIQKSLLEN